MKRVLIYSTSGRSGFEFDTNATTWEELQKDLSQNQVPYSGMKAVLGESRLTLESPKAQVPQQNFTLFLMPKKTKSGDTYDNMSYKECRAAIKVAIEIASNKDDAKEHFSVDGKNYTQTKTEDMKINLRKWFSKGSAKVTEEPAEKPVAEKVVESEVIESKVVKEEEVDKEEPRTTESLLKSVHTSMKMILRRPFVDDLTEENIDSLEESAGAVSAILSDIVIKREEEEKEKQRLLAVEEKKSKLSKEAKAISREFGDLKNL